MGMNDERISHLPIKNIDHWFFPKLLVLYNTYKIKPWIIASNYLFANFNVTAPDDEDNKSNGTFEESWTDHSTSIQPLVRDLVRDDNRFISYRNGVFYSN